MKSVRIVCLGALLIGGVAAAQTGGGRTEIEVVRSLLAAERQDVIAANVTLTAAEAKAFWPLYNAYRDEMRRQGDRLVELAGSYLATARPSEADAAKFIDEYLEIAASRSEIRTRFVTGLRTKVPASTAARVLTLEEKIDAMILVDLFEVVGILKQAPPA